MDLEEKTPKTVKAELLENIAEIKEVTKDYNKFYDLFGKDEAKRTLAKLNQAMSRIEVNLQVSNIKEIDFPKGLPLRDPLFYKKGTYVAVRPCDPKYENKTYLGFLIGDLAISSNISIEDKKLVCSWSMFNPLIFMPLLGDTVLGVGSWWGEIKSIDDLKKITDADIDNVWYVQALKQIDS